MLKLFIIIGTALLGIWGYVGTIILSLIFLATMKSFGKPYLYPLVPFDFKALIRTVIRFPITYRYNHQQKQNQKKSSAK